MSKMDNQKRINHIFDVLNQMNNTDPKYVAWICAQIEDMKFSEKYELKK